ncbi:MAG: hypothetical protein ACOYIS_01895 [Candidatus Cloacimonadaceae bacterium]|jgi:hypothetical protein
MSNNGDKFQDAMKKTKKAGEAFSTVGKAIVAVGAVIGLIASIIKKKDQDA